MIKEQISPRVFTIWSDEIEQRLDPVFYRPEILTLLKKLDATKTYSLGDLILELSGGATPKITEDFYLETGGIPFLRVQNITEEGISLEDVKYIKLETHQTALKRSQLKKDDLVFTITGRIGSVAVVPENFEGNINQHSVRLHLKDEVDGIKISPYYVAVFFNTEIGRQISLRKVTGGTRPALDYLALRSLPVPLPSYDIQEKIVEKVQKVYEEKRKKEEEIKKVLASIDSFVLGELGIEIPEGGAYRIFEIWSDEIQTRFDPLYLRNLAVFRQIKSKYPLTAVSTVLAESPQYGANERAIDGSATIDVRYIRITDIDAYGNLKKDGWKTAEKIEDKYLLRNNDLLLARSGATAGKSFLYKDDFGKAIFAGYLIRFRLDETKVLPDYLFYFTKTRFYELWKNLIQRPSGQPNINSEEFKSFEFPMPPIKTQQKIVDNVRKIYEEAKSLQIYAENLVDVTQRQVESMIFANE